MKLSWRHGTDSTTSSRFTRARYTQRLRERLQQNTQASVAEKYDDGDGSLTEARTCSSSRAQLLTSNDRSNSRTASWPPYWEILLANYCRLPSQPGTLTPPTFYPETRTDSNEASDWSGTAARATATPLQATRAQRCSNATIVSVGSTSSARARPRAKSCRAFCSSAAHASAKPPFHPNDQSEPATPNREPSPVFQFLSAFVIAFFVLC